jgi:tetratricopeptide (TPR) repeat protein
MKTFMSIVILGLFMTLSHTIYGQDSKSKAHAKLEEAVDLMDNGKMDESIALLEEAIKLDPENKYNYSYEMAYAYYLKEDYKKSIKILESIKKEKKISDRYYQLLGNSYDNIGESEKALKTYDVGLKKFPNSGKLYLEKGNVYWNKSKYSDALPFYEEGIKAEPDFSSNYYRAALLYCGSSEKIWGVIYGEIFMNLERNSKRTVEMSKLLYKTYKKAIHIDSDTSGGVNFSSNVLTFNPNSKNVIPFSMAYELNMTLGLSLEMVGKEENKLIELVFKMRTTFIKNWFEKNLNNDYPNVLFDFNKKLIDKGYFEAYNYWLLMKGDEDESDAWIEKNKKNWDDFFKWYSDNSMKINESNKFYKSRY